MAVPRRSRVSDLLDDVALQTYIPSIPDLKLGHAEKERQAADQRVADRKPKTGYIALIPVVYFSVGIAHFTWDDYSDDQDFRNTTHHQRSVDLDNRSMTSDILQYSILVGVANQSKRANLKKWVYHDVKGERGESTLGHSNPSKVSPRNIVTWEDARMLSTVVNSGSYGQKLYRALAGSSSVYDYIGCSTSLNAMSLLTPHSPQATEG
jgi:hypothetical protein